MCHNGWIEHSLYFTKLLNPYGGTSLSAKGGECLPLDPLSFRNFMKNIKPVSSDTGLIIDTTVPNILSNILVEDLM